MIYTQPNNGGAFFQMNKSGLQKLITILPYSICWIGDACFMVLSFILDERLGLKEEALGSHLGFVVSLHAQNMVHEKNSLYFPTICLSAKDLQEMAKHYEKKLHRP